MDARQSDVLASGGALGALASRLPFHYGWALLVAGILCNTFSNVATFWVVTLYVPAISDDFGVPRFPVVLAFMVGQTVYAAVGPLAGSFIDRQGARRALLIGSVAMPAALVLTSRSTELWQLFVGWSLVGATRSLVLPIPFNWLMTRWFQGRRQAALGVLTVGFGLGGAAILPLLAVIEERDGWQAAMVTSAVLTCAVCALVALLLVRDRPSDIGLGMQGARPLAAGETVSAEAEGGFTPREAVRLRTFWLVSVGMLFFFTGQGAVTTLAVDFFESREVQGGAAIIAWMALVRTIGRLPAGLAMSRVRRVFGLAMLASISQAVAVSALIASTEPVGIWTWVLLWGIGGVFAPMLEPLLITRSFGVLHFGAVSGAVTMISFGGQIIGPIAGAALYDATSSYTIPFSLYALGFLVSCALFGLSSLSVRSASHRAAAARAGIRDV